jgi:hypothetical protein
MSFRFSHKEYQITYRKLFPTTRLVKNYLGLNRVATDGKHCQVNFTGYPYRSAENRPKIDFRQF